MSRAAAPVDLVAASLELPTHPVEYAPYAPLRGCDAVANFWCDKNCPHYAEFGSLLARYDEQIVPDQPLAWRCYARHTLDDAEQKYTMGKAYCTRETQLRGIIDACVAKRESQRIMGESASAVAEFALWVTPSLQGRHLDLQVSDRFASQTLPAWTRRLGPPPAVADLFCDRLHEACANETAYMYRGRRYCHHCNAKGST